jgi:hypothetical protein
MWDMFMVAKDVYDHILKIIWHFYLIIIHQNKFSMQAFLFFLPSLGYFTIYPSIYHQIITKIGKLGQKIVQMHPTS